MWEEKAKKKWNTSELTKRQREAVFRDMVNSEQYKSIRIEKFNVNDFKENDRSWDSMEYSQKELDGHWMIIGENEGEGTLGDIIPGLTKRIRGFEQFLG